MEPHQKTPCLGCKLVFLKLELWNALDFKLSQTADGKEQKQKLEKKKKVHRRSASFGQEDQLKVININFSIGLVMFTSMFDTSR